MYEYEPHLRCQIMAETEGGEVSIYGKWGEFLFLERHKEEFLQLDQHHVSDIKVSELKSQSLRYSLAAVSLSLF